MSLRFGDYDRTFTLMDELRRRMNRVWDDVEEWPSSPPTAGAWPRINLYDGGASLVLKADVPGLTEKDLSLTLDDGTLTLSGERKSDAPQGYSVHRQERGSARFARSIALPIKVDSEKTTATIKDGVLTVTLAKSPDAQPRQIAVRSQH
jgi:HSP20 family protein